MPIGTPSFLYATYTQADATPCTDNGTNATFRSASGVLGCPRFGALVRWPLSANGLTAAGPMQMLFNSTCSQFGANGINFVTSDSQGSLLVSTGAGANDAATGAGTDVGQYGAAPCTAPGSTWGGHFNALDPSTFAGKVLLFAAPLPLAPGPFPYPTVFAAGLHNPFRLTWASVPPKLGAPAPPLPSLFAVDTGGAATTQDELNGPLLGLGQSFGWPCFLGAASVAQFSSPALPNSPCALTGPHTPPFFTSAPSAMGSLAALAWHPPTARWVAADPVHGTIISFSPLAANGWSQAAADASLLVEATGVYITQLLWVPASVLPAGTGLLPDSGGALLAVDYVGGKVSQLLLQNATTHGTSAGRAPSLHLAAAALAALGAVVAAAV